MTTSTRVTVRTVTNEQILARVRAFEAAHPGMTRHNYIDTFCDENGELQESAEFFEAVEVYGQLEHCSVTDSPADR